MNSSEREEPDNIKWKEAAPRKIIRHCVRHPELVSSNLILWEPKHGTRSRGRPATTYIDTLRRDIGLSNTGEIRALMNNSDLWRAAIRDSRVGVG